MLNDPIVVEFPWRPISMNNLPQGQAKFGVTKKHRKMARDRCFDAMKEAGHVAFSEPVAIFVQVVYQKSRYDPLNESWEVKVIVDGCRDAGLLVNDTARYVQAVTILPPLLGAGNMIRVAFIPGLKPPVQFLARDRRRVMAKEFTGSYPKPAPRVRAAPRGLPRASKKAASKAAERRAWCKELMRRRPWCELGKMAGSPTKAICRGRSTDPHERLPSGRGGARVPSDGLDWEGMAALCRPCHDWIHNAEPGLANELGFLSHAQEAAQ